PVGWTRIYGRGERPGPAARFGGAARSCEWSPPSYTGGFGASSARRSWDRGWKSIRVSWRDDDGRSTHGGFLARTRREKLGTGRCAPRAWKFRRAAGRRAGPGHWHQHNDG